MKIRMPLTRVEYRHQWHITAVPLTQWQRTWSNAGSWREHHTDAAVRQTLINVADGIGVRDEQPLRFQTGGHSLRWLPSAGEDNPCPESLDLRRRHIGQSGIELVARGRSLRLVDRNGRTAIGKSCPLA